MKFALIQNLIDSLINEFKKLFRIGFTPELRKKLKNKYPNGNGLKILFDSYLNISSIMEKKLSEWESFLLYLKWYTEIEIITNIIGMIDLESTTNKINQLIMDEKPNLFNEYEILKIAKNIGVEHKIRSDKQTSDAYKNIKINWEFEENWK